MKYETGRKDKYNNTEYDIVKICKDMKRVVLGKIKFSNSLYKAMSQRFTIAHYDKTGWLWNYNKNWKELAREIVNTPFRYGEFQYSEEQVNALRNLYDFLLEHSSYEVEI